MYTDYYGLTAPPFQLTPDARFWFASGTHKKAMAYLGYGLAQGEGFIVVTGDIGAGKTTLTGHLMDTIDPARVEAIKIVSTQVEGDDMLRLTAQGLGLPTEGVEKAQLLDRIERHLMDTGRSGRRTLLIIDEAQNLRISALEELRMLSNFQSGGHALLQIFLLGQPEFRDRLADSDLLEQLRQRVIATHHLDPMTADETRGYLEHRLKTVGWTGRPALTEDACAQLHEASGGMPRKLNTLATRALLMGALEQADTIDGALVARVVEDLDGDRPRSVPASAPAAPMHPLLAANVQTPVADDQPDRRVDDLDARLARLESQIHEQDAALRRVLTLLIDWVERDQPAVARAPAA
ncbi:XrtA-associated ATPase [soil metagenome]